MVLRLEALADAIAHFSGLNDPESAAYQNRNPGKLHAYLDRQLQDATGVRIFNRFIDGYQALLFDLRVKCSGQSNTQLKADSSLRDLILSYKRPVTMTQAVVNFLKHALHDESISEKTLLGYFMEDAI